MITKTQMLKYARQDEKAAASYAGFAEFAEGQCKWYFKQRGKIEDTAATWGDDSINVTRWEYCRKVFNQNRREVRDWRKLACRLLLSAKKWRELAAKEKPARLAKP